MDVLITSKSPIDLKRLAIKDPQDAYHFILNYGYDLNNREEQLEVQNLAREAILFIQRRFIDPFSDNLNIPKSIQKASPIELLLLASSSPRASSQKWACAILRVMHTMAHVANNLSANFFPLIQEQVLAPYLQHIYQDGPRTILGTDSSFQLELVNFEIKAGKDRDSAILKLLHKSENVATDIFDRIGVRFVTKDKLDSILVLKYLRERNLVTFPNVKPSRSVNTLININKFRRTLKELYMEFETRDISMEELEEELRHRAQFQDTLTSRQIHTLFNRNPHTSRQYRSIQFTIRQLVHIPNPLHNFKRHINPENLNAQERFILSQEPDEYRFFFPYEVQIVDEKTHNNNLHGLARHDIYKQKQLETSRRRVLGSLIKDHTGKSPKQPSHRK